MNQDEAVRVMRKLTNKYNGQEELKTHKNSQHHYTQFRILGWNNNLDYYQGVLSVRVLTDQSGGTGMKGKMPRISKIELSKRFNIPEKAFLHREWGQGKYRSSVGVTYPTIEPIALWELMEWALVKYGKKWDEARYIHEKLCVDIMEEILGYPAERDTTPSWLSVGTRGSQRLDGYWENINLAIEYNGMQHYEMVPFFHKGDKSKFIDQKKRDKKKRIACRKNNVDLIEIPYKIDLKIDTVRKYIRNYYPDISTRLKI